MRPVSLIAMDDDDRPDSIMRGTPILFRAGNCHPVDGSQGCRGSGARLDAGSRRDQLGQLSGARPAIGLHQADTQRVQDHRLGRGKKAADRAPARPGDDKPPKVILDFIEYSEPGCDSPRRVGVNVIEQQGIIDSVKVVWRAEELNLERGRTLFKKDEMWSVYLSYIPHNVKVQLLAIAEGPKGTTTLGKDISRYCDEDEE